MKSYFGVKASYSASQTSNKAMKCTPSWRCHPAAGQVAAFGSFRFHDMHLRYLETVSFAIILISCVSCQRNIEECITEDLMASKYDWIFELAIVGKLTPKDLAMDELLEFRYERGILSAEERLERIKSGHVQNPSHQSDYGDEFVYSKTKTTLFKYKHEVSSANSFYVKGHGPDERLYGKGFMRGYAKYAEGKFEVLDYVTYRKSAPNTDESLRLRFNYPTLLRVIGCEKNQKYEPSYFGIET